MAIIGVMGSGSSEWPELAVPLGRWLAQNGFDLLTGAGGGVMLAASRAFAAVPERTGRSIGIIPSETHPLLGYVPLAGYPNAFVDMPILTPLPRKEAGAPDSALNRNYVNVLTSDVVIALPGGPGTLDEIRLATRFAKPLMCIGPAAAFDGVPDGTRITSQLADVYAFIGAKTSERKRQAVGGS
ncbi:MAG TPA: DNA-binding protein [Trinickia sp.]|nr:DNA-binding protein [Trinickia sp.]